MPLQRVKCRLEQCVAFTLHYLRQGHVEVDLGLILAWMVHIGTTNELKLIVIELDGVVLDAPLAYF